MKPFLRPIGAASSTPEWSVSEPAGVWAGRETAELDGLTL